MFSADYRQHYLDNLKVASPIVLGMAGHMMTHLSDTIMIGHLGSVPLAAASLALTVFVLFFVVGLGIAAGITPLVGKANGERDDKKRKQLLHTGLSMSFWTGIGLSVFTLLGVFAFPYLGQDAEVARLAEPYYYILSFSQIPFMVYLMLKGYTEGFEITKPAMYSSLAFNLLNVLLNYLLIYGHWGLPALGLEGAAIATLIAKICMAFSLIVYMKKSEVFQKYTKGWGFFTIDKGISLEILKIGTPIGIQYVLEVGAFTVGTIMVGWISPQALAAHQIAISMISLTYLMANGLSIGATIRTSNLIGQKQLKKMKRAANSVIYMVLLFMSICAVLFYAFQDLIPYLFIDEADVIALAAHLLAMAAFFQLFDGLQVTCLGALRGMEDVKMPTWIALISYWIIALPFSYWFGISLGYGAIGIWIGYLIGLGAASALLFGRFEWVSKQLLEQGSQNTANHTALP